MTSARYIREWIFVYIYSCLHFFLLPSRLTFPKFLCKTLEKSMRCAPCAVRRHTNKSRLRTQLIALFKGLSEATEREQKTIAAPIVPLDCSVTDDGTKWKIVCAQVCESKEADDACVGYDVIAGFGQSLSRKEASEFYCENILRNVLFGYMIKLALSVVKMDGDFVVF